jgi:nickel/cobalt transporter (NiCoT) family protein
VVDGLNSNWLAGLLRARDRRARIVSRAMGWFVAMLSFAVAGLGAIRYFSQDVDAAVGAHEASIGIALILAALAAIVLVRRSRASALSQV